MNENTVCLSRSDYDYLIHRDHEFRLFEESERVQYYKYKGQYIGVVLGVNEVIDAMEKELKKREDKIKELSVELLKIETPWWKRIFK